MKDMEDFNQAMFMFMYTNGLLPDSFENIFNKLGKIWQIIKLVSWFIKFQFLANIPFLHTT